jgi:hypothetical protein
VRNAGTPATAGAAGRRSPRFSSSGSDSAMPSPDAPCLLKIDPRNGSMTLSITDSDGLELDYLLELIPPGLDEFACRLHRLDQGPGPYRVSRSPGGRWHCPCKDSRFRASALVRQCKHVKSLKAIYALLEKDRHVRRSLPPQPEETR